MTTYIDFIEDISNVTPTSPYFDLKITVSKSASGSGYWGNDTTHAEHNMSIGGGPQVFNEYGELTGHAIGAINAAKWFVERETNGSQDADQQLAAKIENGLRRIAERLAA